MGPKRPVTDVLGDLIEKETIRGRNDVFCGSVCSAQTWKKIRYVVIPRETGFRNISWGFRNIPMKYFEIFIWNIYSQITTKNGRNNINGRSLHPVRTEKNTTNLSFLRTFFLKQTKQTHMCVCY